ncbi:MAG TPA: SDR family oxidoreductase [Verrucomicrobiae bacterium]|nr:SDR family oxidoreductase [Verrucomicrobiae bacterium]
MSRPSIFITGAATGIGRATAQHFHRGGWCVGLYDVNEAGVRELAVSLGEGALAGKLDVTDAAGMAAALESFFDAAGGRLDVLFNNAGIAVVGDFDALPLPRQLALVDVNLKGVIIGCHAAFPYLKRTPGSRVISMSSASAIYGAPGFASYCATKFAVKGLTEALNIEWDKHGIRCMDVLPLFVDTPMVTQFVEQSGGKPKSMDALGMHLTADDIAATVWRAVNWRWWPRIHWYPGAQSWLLALSSKVSPGWFNHLSTKWVSGY